MTRQTSSAGPPRPTGRSLFQRFPLLLYRGPMASVLRRRFVLLLTTRGPRLGQPRTTPLTYMPPGERLAAVLASRAELALAAPDPAVVPNSNHSRAA